MRQTGAESASSFLENKMNVKFSPWKCLCLFLAFFVFACTQSEEQKKSDKIEADLKNLPKLAPIKIPEGVAGLYIGTLPCDECDTRRIRMELDSSGRAQIEEILFSAKPDTLKSSATFKDSADYVLVRFYDGKRFMNFLKRGGTSLEYLNIEGKPYEDSEGPYRLIRILRKKSSI